MLPISLHVDGAEFYSNSEYLCWSMSSAFSTEHVFDSKFPLVILPHSSMLDDTVKEHVHQTVAKVVGWSLRCASEGVGPLTGPWGEPLTGTRAKLGGQVLAHGWKACFYGFRFDEKARKEVNYFQRSYQHSYICMRCMAQKEHKDWDPEMNYKNMHTTAAHRLTCIGTPLSWWKLLFLFLGKCVWGTILFKVSNALSLLSVVHSPCSPLPGLPRSC